MTVRTPSARDLFVLLALVGVIALYALPVLAAPSAPGAPTEPIAAASPDPSAKPEKSREPKPAKADKAPEQAVTVMGIVGSRTDSEGDLEYTLTRGGTVLVLDAGPAWFFKDKHPLAPFVGKSVTVTGAQRTGSTEVDVQSVDGKVLREPGKPPWAGGWKVVGKDHRGWTQEKWDRWQAKAKERGLECFPPGQCKDKTKAGDDNPAASGAPSGD
ncbi:MAG: hypothetical protein ACSLFN_13625 [Candidatus Limnocylindrales bacterium]